MGDPEIELTKLGYRKDTVVATFQEGVSPWQAAQTGAIAALPLAFVAFSSRAISMEGVHISIAASLLVLLLAVQRRRRHRRRFLQEMKLIDADANSLKAHRRP